MYRVRTEFVGPSGAPWLSTAYFSSGGGTAAQAVNTVGTMWTAIDTLMHNTVSWSTDPLVDDVDPITGQVTATNSTTPATGTGNLAGTILPRANQALIRWLTGEYVGGRQIRGRTFVPGLTTAAMTTGGVLLPANATTIGNAALAAVTDLNSNLVIWSRKNGLTPTVQAVDIWGEFAVLRTRRD